MERDDDIEKISKELEDILKMTSDEKKDKTPDIQKKTDDRQDTGFLGDVGEEQPDYDSMPVIRLEVPVEGMEELYDFNDSDEDGESYPADEYVMTEEDGEEEIGEEEPFEEEHQEVLRSFRKKEHRSGSLVKDSDGLIAAFFVPVIIMIIIFAQRGIFPFGEESFLRTDMYHQYAPFFSEFQYKLTLGGSLLYSWDIGMGVNFAALYSYYLASPLNWLIVLCPK